MGAVSSGEGIVNKNIGQLGKLIGEFTLVKLFAHVKTSVLEEGDLAGLELVDGGFGGTTDTFGSEVDTLAKQSCEFFGNWCEGLLR